MSWQNAQINILLLVDIFYIGTILECIVVSQLQFFLAALRDNQQVTFTFLIIIRWIKINVSRIREASYVVGIKIRRVIKTWFTTT